MSSFCVGISKHHILISETEIMLCADLEIYIIETCKTENRGLYTFNPVSSSWRLPAHMTWAKYRFSQSNTAERLICGAATKILSFGNEKI